MFRRFDIHQVLAVPVFLLTLVAVFAQTAPGLACKDNPASDEYMAPGTCSALNPT